MQCFTLRHIQLSGECQITTVYMIPTWCNWLDASPTSVTAASPPLTPQLLHKRTASQSARCISSSCVPETGTDCLCKVAGRQRPRSYTKESLFSPEPAALRAAATEEAVAQTNTHYTRVPQNKKGCEMLTPLCFPHSGGSVCMGQLLRSQLGSIHISIMSCSFKTDWREIVVNAWLIIVSKQHESQELVHGTEKHRTATVAREVTRILGCFFFRSVAH